MDHRSENQIAEPHVSSPRMLLCVASSDSAGEIEKHLQSAGWQARHYSQLSELCGALCEDNEGTMVSESYLGGEGLSQLSECIAKLPSGSEYPLFILLDANSSDERQREILLRLPGNCHPIMLEQPLRSGIFAAALRGASLARERQREFRAFARRNAGPSHEARGPVRPLGDLEFIQDPLLILDDSASVRFANRACASFFDVQSSGDCVGQAWHKLWPAGASEDAAIALEAARVTGIGVFDYTLSQHDGPPRHWDVLVSALPSGTRQGDAYVAIARDITRHKEEVDRTHDGLNRYETAIAASGQLLYDWRPQTNELAWTGNAESFLGYPTSTLEGGFRRWLEFVHPDDREHMEEEVKRRTAGGECRPVQYRVMHSHGHYVEVEDRGNFVFDEHGSLSHLMGFISDISERKRAEKEIQRAIELRERSLAKLEAVIRSMSEGLVICDRQGHLIAMNPAALALYGFHSVEEAREARSQIHDLFEIRTLTGERVPEEDWALRRALRGERFQNYEVIVERRNGTGPWIASYSGTGVLDRHGRQTLAVVTVRDITGQKQAEQELKRLNETLEQRVAERTRSLLNYQQKLRALASDLTLTEQRERRRIASELHDFLAQLLVAAKMKRRILDRHIGSADAQSAAEDLDTMLDQALQYTRTLIADLSPSILYDAGLSSALKWLADRMEQQHGLHVELVDKTSDFELTEEQAILVFQTVRELLFNIVKHAQTDRATLTLTEEHGNLLVAHISDEGVGFDTSNSSTPSTNGKFGLFHVRERLEALGGAFDIRSAVGNGTVAVFKVPLQRTGTAGSGLVSIEEAVAEDSDGADEIRRARGVVRVLLVDDHEVVREGLRAVIESYPDILVIGEAADGSEAIELVDRLQPDAVIMDLNMPQIDGIEATREIKRGHSAVTIIGLSVHDDKELESAMKAAGASAYLIKGSSTDELYHALRAAQR